MRSLGFALFTLLIGSAAMAADPPQQTSPSSTLAVVAPAETQRVDVEIGAAEINTHAARIRIAYLPRLAPLPGTLPRSIAETPNAFELLGTSLPYRPGLRPASIVIRRP
jgi:hypothetical protein